MANKIKSNSLQSTYAEYVEDGQLLSHPPNDPLPIEESGGSGPQVLGILLRVNINLSHA